MAKPKPTVLFIVEGGSDETALKRILKKLYKKKEINFEVTDGDITSDESVNVQNVEEKIFKIVKKFMNDKKLSKNNIIQIVQIFDTDGAFIKKEFIEKGESSKFEYTLNSIRCKYPRKVEERNERKSKVMNYLLNIQDIKGISYDKLKDYLIYLSVGDAFDPNAYFDSADKEGELTVQSNVNTAKAGS